MAKARQNTRAGTGNVRVIAGQFRGRKLPVLDLAGLRPTTDRVKETVFNWLMPYLRDAQCLDCFAGSGALGIEALSRFASHVTFIEKNSNVAKQLKQNIATLNVNNASVQQADCLSYLNQASRAFDIVFVDPPFNQGLSQPCCHALETHGWLTKEALIYLECEQTLAPDVLPSNWRLLKDKQAGQVSYRLYQRQG